MSRIVVVSNRVPVPQGNAGQAGGLAVALLGLMQRRGGLWFGWSGAVTETVAPPGLTQRGGVGYATIDLTEAEHRGYYTGYSNGVLWPMLHSLPHLMSFRRQDLDVYRKVNRRFADNLVPLLRPDDRIWVHDYHLMSLPGALRQRGVLGADRLLPACPLPGAGSGGRGAGHPRLVQDVLACDLLGFQTATDRDNFAATAVGFAGAVRTDGPLRRARRPAGAARRLPGRDRRPGIRRAPPRRRRKPSPTACWRGRCGARRCCWASTGWTRPRGCRSGWRPSAASLARRPARSLTMLQIAAPSREDVAAYRRLRQEIDARPAPSTANSASPTGPRCACMAGRRPATRWPASCARPGSASSRRSATA